jgi:hypothetical protein
MVPAPVKILCYAALADLFTYLPKCKASPQALDVRQKLQLASWMSLWPLKMENYRYPAECTLLYSVPVSQTIGSALGLSHALGHKLGAAYNIPHGITSVGTRMVKRLEYSWLTSSLVSDTCSHCCTKSRDRLC